MSTGQGEPGAGLKVTLFGLAVGASLVGLVLALGLTGSTSASDPIYDVVFPTSAGLLPGAPVMLLGVTVGEVVDLAIDEHPRSGALAVRVRMKVRQSHARLMREGMKVRQVPRGLLGERVLEVLPAPAGARPLAPGVPLTGEVPVDIPELLTQVAAAVADLRSAAREIKTLVSGSEFQAMARGVAALAQAIGWAVERLEALVKHIKEVLPGSGGQGKEPPARGGWFGR